MRKKGGKYHYRNVHFAGRKYRNATKHNDFRGRKEEKETKLGAFFRGGAGKEHP